MQLANQYRSKKILKPFKEQIQENVVSAYRMKPSVSNNTDALTVLQSQF